ncbi:hypothetical protein LCGC14_2298140 [marine sediment metagenome]|uniref:Uncharacterized protein n=1 Tax=marine sediment metagenome TaxID=412755 RepID=A0A0F9CPQ1_9ZZZZ
MTLYKQYTRDCVDMLVDGDPYYIEATPQEVIAESYKLQPVVKIHEFVFEELLEYSTSTPTGVYAGKRWKRRIHENGQWTDKWLLGEYIDDGADDGTLLTRWTPIEIIPRKPLVPFPVKA